MPEFSVKLKRRNSKIKRQKAKKYFYHFPCQNFSTNNTNTTSILLYFRKYKS